MINVDFEKMTYVCPFCGHAQAFSGSLDKIQNGFSRNYNPVPPEYVESSFTIYTLLCSNRDCRKVAVTAVNRVNGKQVDILPKVVIRKFPEYIPEQILSDYREASLILDSSPKAAATLLRRCLQGMIRDFWGIHESSLFKEISALEGRVYPSEWKAIDGLRRIGNIGAHMERDVNLIIDIDADEAGKLLKLIEMLLEKWYIARHDEQELLEDIVDIAEEKEAERKG